KELRVASLKKMTDAIFHRGPDGLGEYHNEYVSLGMRRLAIVDVEGGNQPIWNEDKSIGVIFNGEIYNFKQLKKSLIAVGHKFYSHSDTEVLVHLYEEYGDLFPNALRGMFALCIFDLHRNRYLLARDAFGEKPLYYHLKKGVLTFCSELGGLLQNHQVDRKVDHESLRYYLASGYIPEPLTLVSNCKSLEPGHILVYKDSQLVVRRYNPLFHRMSTTGKVKSEEEAISLIKPKLENAVEGQLIGDVPVGAFLSGGIDSSTICAIAQEKLSRPLDTFTVRFEDAEYDESPIARAVADRIGSNHHEITVPNKGFDKDIFEKILTHVGFPFPDPSAIPVFLVTKEIRKYVKVALSGDGGDEVFAGYDDLGWWLKIKRLAPLSPWLLEKISKGILAIPGSYAPNVRRKMARAFRAVKWGESGLSFGIHRMIFEKELLELFPSLRDYNYHKYTSWPDEFSNMSSLRKAMRYRLVHKLPTDMLIKVDRMSMANSLEVRAPFLDLDLFKASLSLDDKLLWRNNIGKQIIRKMMKDKLPEVVFKHPKMGFSMPMHTYQNQAYRDLSNELLSSTGPLASFVCFDRLKKIEQIMLDKKFNSLRATPDRACKQHWMLLLLAGWMDKYQIQF
ncbi:MAG: asparagine synthase (glutamine-hydrolyzing), partial [Bacteroidota bacterium]